MFVMYDSVTVDEIPVSAPAVAGYVGGSWPTFHELVPRFPHAHRLSIAVNSGEDADCLDIEKGDATPAEAPAWFHRQRARGVYRPCFYASLSVMPEVIAALANAGIQRHEYRLWVAHYTYVPHIEPGYDACQWTDRALGRNLDESLCVDDFFGKPDPLGVLEPYEHQEVVRYDRLLKHPHLHEHGLRVVHARLVALRKAIWIAAERGHLPDGKPVEKGWNVRDRAQRYRILLSQTR
jgi:hypothetical protein